MENTPHVYRTLITLTYRGAPVDGRAVKADLRAFTRMLRVYKVFPRSAVWILEFQRRGSPHFHLLSTDFVPKGAVSYIWSWTTGESAKTSTNVKAIRRPLGYALKYAAKLQQKEPPDRYKDLGRFWGIVGCRCRYECEASRLGVPRDDMYGMIQNERNHEVGKAIYDHRRGFLAFDRGRR